MTLRELVESCLADGEPMVAGFVIAGFLRTAVQGEASTFEGECASLNVASKHFDINTESGIRAWLADLDRLPDLDMPESWWAKIVAAHEADEANDEGTGGTRD